MSKTVVVIGGGAYGISSANSIQKQLGNGYKVKLISISNFSYFLPAAIRLPITKDYENVLIPLTEVVDKGIDIIIDEAISFDETSVTTKSGKLINFDVLVLATGSRWSNPVSTTFDFGDNYKEHFEQEYEKLKNAKHILLIGGGFVNSEFAGEIIDKYEEDIKAGKKKISIVHNSDKLLPEGSFYGDRLRDDLTNWLKNHGVKLYLNSRGEKSTEDPTKVIINGNEEVEADLIYYGTGAKPIVPANELKDLTNARGFVRVSKTFQTKAASNIFAIGDNNDFEYHGLVKKDNWIKTISTNVVKYLKEGSKATLSEASTFENAHIPSVVSLGPNNGLGQLPLPIFGTVRAPEFLAVKAKSKKLFTDKSKKMFA